MRNLRVWLVLFCVLASATAAYADDVLDCSKKSLAVAIDGLTLRGVGTAIIDGGGLDAVTVIGASRVSLIDIDVTNGAIGILARNGADVSLTRVNAHDNS